MVNEYGQQRDVGRRRGQSRRAFLGASLGTGFGLAALRANASDAAADSPPRVIRLEPVGGRPHPPVITALALSPDGRTLAAGGDDHAIRLLRVSDGSLVRVLSGHDDWVRSLDFSRDGRQLVSAGNDGQVLFWRESREWSAERSDPNSPAVGCARFCPTDGLVAAAGFDREVLLLDGARPTRRIATCGCRDMRAICFAEDGRHLALGGRTGVVHVVDPRELGTVAEVRAHRGRIRQAVFLPGTATVATCGEDGQVAVIDAARGEVIQRVEVRRCKLLAIAAIDHHRVAVGGTDNRVRVINLDAGKTTGEFTGHRGSVAALVASPRMIVSGSFDTTIRFWDPGEAAPGGERVAERAARRAAADR